MLSRLVRGLLLGQSLGGVFARELARLDPDRVRHVITLGSPFTGHPLASTGTHHVDL